MDRQAGTRLRGAGSTRLLLYRHLLVLVVGSLVATGCTGPGPVAPAAACADPPDAYQTLVQAWQAYQPDQPLSPAVSVRRRLFVLQALLLSAGMYDDPPSDRHASTPSMRHSSCGTSA